MKRVIDGRVYDTEKAELIGEDANDYGRSDFRWYEEALYKTANGRWFVAGKGGPMSGYARTMGNSTTEGSGLRVLTEAEAQQWCEEARVDPEVMRAHFTLEEA